MKKRYVMTALLLCYVGFIFSNSLTPAVESAQQSGWVLNLAKQMAAAVGIDGPWLTDHLIRKTAHFTEYTLLGILLWGTLRTYGLTGKLWMLFQLWLGLVIPLTDETLQLFTAGRSGQVSDVWLDFSGVCAGTLAAAAAGKILAGRILAERKQAGRKQDRRHRAKKGADETKQSAGSAGKGVS